MIALAIGSALLLAAIFMHFGWPDWIGELLWLLIVLATDRSASRTRRALAKMWRLADQLGYNDAKIAQLTPQYGRIDWQLTHLDNIQFQPSIDAIRKVTSHLEATLKTQQLAADR